MDRKRKKKTSNEDWESPSDGDAEITKLKDGRTALAYKAENAVDMETGAIVAVTTHGGAAADTATVEATVIEAGAAVAELVTTEPPEGNYQVHPGGVEEVVADKGYHSNAKLVDLQQLGIRTYISEPKRGRRNWTDKKIERDAVYANRRRIRGRRGKDLLRQRGVMLERSFAHCYETGAMRRVHLRGHENILKRLLVHVAGFNLSLVLRLLAGKGTPRGLHGLETLYLCALIAAQKHLEHALRGPYRGQPVQVCLLPEHGQS